MRFTIRRSGSLLGTYEGKSHDEHEAEAQAFDALAQSEGHESFQALCKATGLKRDDHSAEPVKE